MELNRAVKSARPALINPNQMALAHKSQRKS